IPWLEGIDPLRNYWIAVNGDQSQIVTLLGLTAASFEEFKQVMRRFRSLKSGETLLLGNSEQSGKIMCISSNCYADEADLDGAPV
ncbi:hypothetical protein, partial [Burkholderia sp. SIMBA_024]|uniref:hypothetical protein n=1 Tax=Burkholderia sp. SIMBA_024 TaxID=3085768 RepID=UPI0039788057